MKADFFLVCNNADSFSTGFASRVRYMSKLLASRGMRVIVIRFIPRLSGTSYWPKNFFLDNGVTLIQVPCLPISRYFISRIFSTFFSSVFLYLFYFIFRPNVIQAETHDAVNICFRLARFCRLYVDLHGAGPEEALYTRIKSNNTDLSIVRWLGRAEKNIIKYFDKLIYVAPNMLAHLERKYSLDLSDRGVYIPIIPADIFLQKFNKTESKKQANLEDRVVFLYSGGMQIYQCVEQTLTWFSEIYKVFPRAKLLILTPSPDLAEEFVKIGFSNIQSAIDIRSVLEDELPSLMAAADFGFVLRENEILNLVSAPTKIMEYISCGVELICTEYSGNGPYLVKNYDAGIVVSLLPDCNSVNELIEFVSIKLSRVSNNNVNHIFDINYDNYLSN